MKLIDLTHPISPSMPVYPGTEQPIFETGCSIEEDGFLERKITMYSHTGTHVDAPAHLIKNSKTLDQLPIDHFYGKGFLLDCTNVKNRAIDLSELEPYMDIIKEVDFLLIHTGWSKYWGEKKYFSDYPVLSLNAAKWLSETELKGIGLDTISADKADSQDFPVHKTLLGNNIIIIENLTNLEKILNSEFTFSCFPLTFEYADGSPVRAVGHMQF